MKQQQVREPKRSCMGLLRHCTYRKAIFQCLLFLFIVSGVCMWLGYFWTRHIDYKPEPCSIFASLLIILFRTVACSDSYLKTCYNVNCVANLTERLNTYPFVAFGQQHHVSDVSTISGQMKNVSKCWYSSKDPSRTDPSAQPRSEELIFLLSGLGITILLVTIIIENLVHGVRHPLPVEPTDFMHDCSSEYHCSAFDPCRIILYLFFPYILVVMLGAIFWGSTAVSQFTCNIDTCTAVKGVDGSYTLQCGVLVVQKRETATMTVGNYWTSQIAQIMLDTVYMNDAQVQCHSGVKHASSDYFDSTTFDFKSYSMGLAGKVMVIAPQILLFTFVVSLVIWRRVLRSSIQTGYVSLNDEREPLTRSR